MEQQESCSAEGGGGLEGLGWSSREAAGEAAAGAAEGLQRRGIALVCSVCTVDRPGLLLRVRVRGDYFLRLHTPFFYGRGAPIAIFSHCQP